MAAVSGEEWHKWTGVASCFVTPSSLPPSLHCHLLTPPKDDMEIHVSASLTMRSRKAIKAPPKKSQRPQSVCHCHVYWLMTKKTIERSSTERGRRRQTEGISFVASNIQKGDVRGHFSLPFLLLYYVNQRASGTLIRTDCHRRVLRAEWVGGEKNTKTSFRDVSFLTVVSIALS